MRVEYDRKMCGGWFQCVQEWDAFEMDLMAGKVDLEKSEETEEGLFIRDIPDSLEAKAIAAAESCPVDAIKVYDNDEKIAPTE